MMTKVNPYTAAPDAMKEWFRTSSAIAASVDPVLAELVKVRASQINGCANCINLHTTFAREAGETEQRLYLLSAWRHAPCFSERERAVLGWTESLTRLTNAQAISDAYDLLRAHFTEAEQVQLTLLVNVINGWNRISVGFDLWTEPAAVKAMIGTTTVAA